jgi:hypothetical protein
MQRLLQLRVCSLPRYRVSNDASGTIVAYVSPGLPVVVAPFFEHQSAEGTLQPNQQQTNWLQVTWQMEATPGRERRRRNRAGEARPLTGKW